MHQRTPQKQALAFCALLSAAALAACADGANVPLLQSSGSNLRGESTFQRINRLRIGDKLQIVIYGEKDLSGTFEINAAGKISMPLIGDIDAAGRAIPELRRAITARLSKGYLKSPRVSIESMNYRPIYVHGEVRKGGEYPFRTGLRLRDTIALAGGFTYRASQGYVLIVRNGSRGEFKVPLKSNIEILPGDNIRVPERFF